MSIRCLEVKVKNVRKFETSSLGPVTPGPHSLISDRISGIKSHLMTSRPVPVSGDQGDALGP